YGYKIEYQGKQIVIAGDTKYSENVIKQSKQVDVLIHPVTQIPEKLLKENPNYQAIYDHLSSPEDAAKVFKKTQPKLAVFSHIGLNGNSTVKQLVDRVSKTYKGRLLVGEDLTHIQIGQDENDITIWHD